MYAVAKHWKVQRVDRNMEPISDSLVAVYYSVPWSGTGLVILLGPAGARASHRALSHSNGVKISLSEHFTTAAALAFPEAMQSKCQHIYVYIYIRSKTSCGERESN